MSPGGIKDMITDNGRVDVIMEEVTMNIIQTVAKMLAGTL